MTEQNRSPDTQTLARIEKALETLSVYVREQEKIYTARFTALENTQFKCQLAVNHRIKDVERYVEREEQHSEKAPALWTGFISAGAVCIGVIIQFLLWWLT